MKGLSEMSRNNTTSGMMNTSIQLHQTSLQDGLQQSSSSSTFAAPSNLIPHSHSQHQEENPNKSIISQQGIMEQNPVTTPTSESSGVPSPLSSAVDPAMITASGKKAAVGRWTEEEHRLFLEGLRTFPYRAWKKIATLIETRTVVQIRTHAQKYYQKLQKEGLPKETPHLEEHQQRQKMRQQKAAAATTVYSKELTDTGNMMMDIVPTTGETPKTKKANGARMKVRKLAKENVNGRYTSDEEFEEDEDEEYSSSTTTIDHPPAIRRHETAPAKRKRKSTKTSRRNSVLGNSHFIKTDQMIAKHKRIQILRRASISSMCSTSSSAIAGDDELDDEFNSTNEEDEESLDFSGFSSSQEENSTSMIRMKMKHKLLFLSGSSHNISDSPMSSDKPSISFSSQHQPEDESSSMDEDPFLQSSQATSMETEIENLPLHIQLIDHGNEQDEEVQDLKEEIENVNFLHLSPMSKEMGDFNTDEESLQWFGPTGGATTSLSKLPYKKTAAVKKILVFQDVEDQLHRSLTEEDEELLTEEEDFSCCSSSYYAQSLNEILDYGFKSGSYSTVTYTSVGKTEETVAAKIDDMDPEDFVNNFFTTKVIC